MKASAPADVLGPVLDVLDDFWIGRVAVDEDDGG
jgi:hypothetical protein